LSSVLIIIYRKEVIDLCPKKNILIEAYSPLTKGRKLSEPKLVELAHKYEKTPAQILISWILEKEFIVIPKSVKENRIKENAYVFEFSISEDDIKYLESFNENLITGWDPTSAP
jgi:diketogulonate reductase-like aldo/keto reductase